MTYLWIKALHVTAVIGWIGGMLVQSIALSAARESASAGATGTPRFVLVARLWDSRVTSLSIFLVWVLGGYMAVTAGWLGSGWLWVKLVVAVVLSAVHGIQAGLLRRMAAGSEVATPAWIRHAAPGTLVGVFVIVCMVIVKPF